MWELIRANQRKSILLFIGMAVCLLCLGYVIGAAIEPEMGSFYGLAASGLIWIVLSLISFYSGDNILLSSGNATEVSREIHPQLFNVVEEMKIAANLPKVPKVYMIDEEQPNAFATGRDPEHASITVTAGLLSRLNRDELQGVIAHETSHILNRDILYMTCASVMLGSISILSEIFLRSTRMGGVSRRYRSSARGGQGQIVMILFAIAFSIIAPILVQILYFSLSRKREYLADASGARLTRYPEGLASALEKISRAGIESVTANKITAPMYIVNPLQMAGESVANLWSTHPPISERIQILRNMAQGANFRSYEEAFQKVKGKGDQILPLSARNDTAPVEIRPPNPGQEPIPIPAYSPTLNDKATVRHLGDLKRAINQYAFVSCQCGLRFKIPPDFHKGAILCPRCFSQVKIPEVGAVTSSIGVEEPLTYRRMTTGWESFTCSCGRLMQLSPEFSGTKLECQNCGQVIKIESSNSYARG